MPQILLPLGASLAGLCLVQFLNISGGAFIGAIAGAAVVRLAWDKSAAPPKPLQFFARTLIGIIIGIPVNRQALQTASSAIVPIALMIIGLIGLCFFSAWLTTKVSKLDTATAFCGSSPGAATTMVVLSEDLGGQTPIVAVLHSFRLILIVVLMPIGVKVFQSTGALAAAVETAAAAQAIAGDSPAVYWLKLAGLLAGSLCAAYFFRKWKVPAAEIMAGILVAAIGNPLFLRLETYPAIWRPLASWIIGAAIGCQITRSSLRAIRHFIPVCGVLTLLLVAAGILLGCLLSVTTSLDIVTALLGACPGGIDAMVLLAGEMHASAPLVATMHTIRQILIMLTMPFLIRRIVGKSRR
ncbi:MAG: AbrB family transcriptional regulator [Spirochaetia bacterium]|jgi:membrane AbrB-like protein|nr:AbrB family transcriptional regulator [Spirochaetia bacterium]